jgi:hypothetical protein
MRLLTVLPICLLALSARAGTLEFRGQAFDPDSQTLLYSERHVVERDQDGRYLRSRVDYFHPDGSPLGVKQADFDLNPFLPSLSFEDFRTGVFTRLDSGAAQATLNRRNPDQPETRVRDIEVAPGRLVIADAGFDRMVMAHWAELIDGATVAFEFVTLGHGRMVELRMKRVGQEANRVRFEVEAQNWLFRLLLDPIRLVYDLESRRLLEYTGVTNIPNTQGGQPAQGNMKARIVYDYVSVPAHTVLAE